MKLLDLFPAKIKANPLGQSGRVSYQIPGDEIEQDKTDLVKSTSTSKSAIADHRCPQNPLHRFPK